MSYSAGQSCIKEVLMGENDQFSGLPDGTIWKERKEGRKKRMACKLFKSLLTKPSTTPLPYFMKR